MNLKGKVALVTGGSRGIGRAICLRLAGAGAFVFVNYARNEKAARETLRPIGEAGGEGKIVCFDVADYKAATEAIAGLITPKTRAILLVTPSNPTGAVTPPETLAKLYLLAEQRRIALVLDETYNEFIAGGKRPHELFAMPGWDDHLIHITSFGKTYALTGYRAGMLVASKAFIHHALKAQDTMAVCQPRITQHAVRFGVDHLDSWVTANRVMMERRHDRFCAEFMKSGNPFRLVASGAFETVGYRFAPAPGKDGFVATVRFGAPKVGWFAPFTASARNWRNIPSRGRANRLFMDGFHANSCGLRR